MNTTKIDKKYCILINTTLFKPFRNIFEVQNHQNLDFSFLTTRWRSIEKIFLPNFSEWSI